MSNSHHCTQQPAICQGNLLEIGNEIYMSVLKLNVCTAVHTCIYLYMPYSVLLLKVISIAKTKSKWVTNFTEKII